MGIRKRHTVTRGRKEWRRTELGSQGPQWTVVLEEKEEEGGGEGRGGGGGEEEEEEE